MPANNVDFQLSLATEPVSSVFSEAPLATGGTASVASVMELLCSQRTKTALICESETPTEREAVRLTGDGKAADFSPPVNACMTAPVDSLSAVATVGETIASINRRGYRHLPIVGRGEIRTGLVSARGIMQYIAENFSRHGSQLAPKAPCGNV